MKSLLSRTSRRFAQTSFITMTLIVASPILLHAQREEIRRAEKSPSPTFEEPRAMYPGTITGGVKSSDSYTEGSFSIVAPIYSTLGSEATLSGGLIFIEPYISWGEGGEVATSLGLGFRHLFGSQNVSALTKHDGHQAGFWEEGWYLGANVFVDMLDTEADNQFWQLGVGAEVGTRYIELRGNYYIPLSEKQLAEERRSRETFRTSRSSSSTSSSQGVTPLNNPYATGNTVVQDAMFTNYNTRITRTTTTTTTIERLFQRFEEGMEGWDAEIAILVPGLDRWMDVMLIGGYYSFDNQPFGPQQGGTGNVEGWKAGVEIRPVPALIFSGTWYEDERLTGSDWTVGVQMQIPFEAGDLGDGKNFWSRIGDSFKPRRRHLMERMAEPVSRQNTAVKIANSVKESEKVVAQKTSTSVKRQTRVVSQSQQHLVLVDDIVFVNNDGPVGNGIQAGTIIGNGTAELPMNTVQAGANIAGANSTSTGRVWKVYTQGGGANYVEDVTLVGSTNFTSSRELIPGVAGTSFGTGDSPVVDGGFRADFISFIGVRGYTIQGGYNSENAISALNVDRLEAERNTINNVGGIGIQFVLDANTVSSGWIAENEIDTTVGHGIVLGGLGMSNLTATVRDNIITNAGRDGISAGAGSSGVATVTLANNRIVNAADEGVGLYSNTTAILTAYVQDNDLIQSAGYGIGAEGTDDSTMTLTATGNFIDQTTLSGVCLNTLFTSEITATLNDNVIQFSGDRGLLAQSDQGSTMTLSGIRNTITSSGDAGIGLISDESSEFTATLIGNEISDSLYRGIQAESNLTSTMKLTAQDNSITDSADHGVFLRSNGGSSMTADLHYNDVEDTSLDGIHAEASDGSVLTLNATANSLSLIDNTAINVSSDDSASLFATLQSNELLSFNSEGISGSTTDSGRLDLKAYDNVMNTAGFAGVEIDADENSLCTADLARNSISGTYQGIAASSSGLANLQITATSNIIEHTDDYGIYLNSNGSSTLGATLTGNNVTDTNSSGILLESNNDSMATFAVTGNRVDTSTSYGMELSSRNTSENTIVLDGNSILNTDDDGIRAFEAAPGSTLLINGTISNTINNNGLGRYTIYGGFPSGTIIINGVSVDASTSVP